MGLSEPPFGPSLDGPSIYLDTSVSQWVDATLGSSSFVDLNTAYNGTNSGLSSGTKAFILDSTDTLYFDPATDTSGQDTNEGYLVIAADVELIHSDISIIG